MSDIVEIRPLVRQALEGGRPVVALESTVVAHGLPIPVNLEAAGTMERAVREAGAEPATIGVVHGVPVIGLSEDEIERLASDEGVLKLSTRDLAPAIASGSTGATTVAATLRLARLAGIRIMATGGIGGVHRGVDTSLDVSADLGELARTPAAVVCSGAKAILDLPRTLEALETLGVPVVGYRTRSFPGYYSTDSGLRLAHRIDDPAQAAALVRAQASVAPGCGLLICQPPPADEAIDGEELAARIADALAVAERSEVRGPELTPFLLRELAEGTAGRAVTVNRALLVANASLAGRIAEALSRE